MEFQQAAKKALEAYLQDKHGRKKYNEAVEALQSRHQATGRNADDDKFFYQLRYFLGEENPAQKNVYELLVEALNEKLRGQVA
ncbi:MAG: hypothetical protein EOP00_21260 [Pedobacter sp.]|nr:MAG: hypothetical protein EOP00_21260 [Pedobacter sp.]